MLFGNRHKPSRDQIAAVKEWAAELLPIPLDANLLVTELACHEEGCPPIETVIAVLEAGHKPRQWKLHKSIAEITREDMQALAADATHGDAEPDCHVDSAAERGSCHAGRVLRDWRCPD